ncbi:putative myosin heavy chain [Besnoitia besnoiti]|uniref:Putative myosin heavy chain n=1 Tax=Besnoitia besnoiti TaxID=94643 RepID=A0A2A9M6G4_BESBE|nr:putative myosin heavy chain [Besnoitia besnoiti]PFH31901.1 putative myosin heavy chain [Besnoitia besnoiti]
MKRLEGLSRGGSSASTFGSLSRVCASSSSLPPRSCSSSVAPSALHATPAAASASPSLSTSTRGPPSLLTPLRRASSSLSLSGSRTPPSSSTSCCQVSPQKQRLLAPSSVFKKPSFASSALSSSASLPSSTAAGLSASSSLRLTPEKSFFSKTSRKNASPPLQDASDDGVHPDASSCVCTPHPRGSEEGGTRQASAALPPPQERLAKFGREAVKTEGVGDELLLNRKFVGDKGCKGVAASLMRKTNFVRIDLSANNISAEGIAALLPGLSVQRGLRHLDLNWNALSAAGTSIEASGGSRASSRCMYTLQSFCDWIAAHSALRTLSLSHCRLGNEGAACVADLLSRNTSLVSLDLSYNGMGAAACTRLAQAAEASNFTLLHVDLGGNCAGCQALELLARACARNRLKRQVRRQHEDAEERTALRDEQLKRQQLQTYVLQLEKEMTLRQEEFGKLMDGMLADAAEASRKLERAQEETRELRERLRNADFELIAERRNARDAASLKKELQALQATVCNREQESSALESRLREVETEKQLQDEELRALRLRQQEAADAAVFIQQSLDDTNASNKKLEACVQQKTQRIEELRGQLASAERAAEERSEALLAQLQSALDAKRGLEDTLNKLSTEKEHMEQRNLQLAWALEAEERDSQQRRAQQEQKRKEEQRLLAEQAEEWKNRLKRQLTEHNAQEERWKEERLDLFQRLRQSQQATCDAETEVSALRHRERQRDVHAQAAEEELCQLRQTLVAREDQQRRERQEHEALLLAQRRKEEQWRATLAASEAAAGEARLREEAKRQEATHLEDALAQRDAVIKSLQEQIQQSKQDLAKSHEARQQLERERVEHARELREARARAKKLEEDFQRKCNEAFEALRLSLSTATSILVSVEDGDAA